MSLPSASTDRIALAGLLLIAALAPVRQGLVGRNETALITAAAFAIGAFAFATPGWRERVKHLLLPSLALTGVAALGLLQLVPLPRSLLGVVAPASADVYLAANRVLELFGRDVVAAGVSIAPASTLATALLTLAYAVLFVSAASVATTARRRQLVVATLVVSSLMHVLLAAAQSPSRVHGAFVNPNHFAGYLQLSLACSVAGVWLTSVRDGRRRARTAAIAAVVLWACFAGAIGMTASRGAMLAASAATVVILLLSARASIRVDARPAGAAAIVAAGIALAIFAAGEAPFARFREDGLVDASARRRVVIWRSSVEATAASPLVGTGLGTFREAFRRVQPASIRGTVEEAHNELLQIAVTGGVAGALLASIAAISTLFVLARGWLSQHDPERAAMCLAAFGALLALLLHGAVEFNLSIPAIASTLAVLCGTGAAATATPTA